MEKKNGWKIYTDISPKKTYRMTNKHMKRCSAVLIIREMQIKTTMRYCFTSVRMAIIKKTINNKCWWGCGEKEPSYTVDVGFPSGSDHKESACSAGDLGSNPGSGRSPGEGNGNPLQYSCLENPMNRGAWRAGYSLWGYKELDMTRWLTTIYCWWEYKLVQPLWRTVWRWLKKLKIGLLYDPTIPLLGIYLEKTII